MIEAGIPPYEQKAALARRALSELRGYVSMFMFEKDVDTNAFDQFMEGIGDVKITLMAMGEHNDQDIDPVQQIFHAQTLTQQFDAVTIPADFDDALEVMFNRTAQPIHQILMDLQTHKTTPVSPVMLETAAANLGQFYQWVRSKAPVTVVPQAPGETYGLNL